jgi:fibronectin type III domain protein
MATKTKIPKLTITHNFSRTKVPALLTQAQKVMTNINGAPATFPNPPVPMTQIQADITALTASSAAATDGSKKDIAQRNKDHHTLEQDMTLTGAYVVKIANGDAAIIAASGFTAAPPRVHTTPQPLPQPATPSVTQGNSGQALVQMTPIPKAKSYEIQAAPMANGVPGTWTTTTVTAAKRPISIAGLTPGTTYAFRVRTLGVLGYTDYSDSATRMMI